ncbi:MAG: LppP/LprE family lipoprotein [Cyanobacteria bacterium P01_F01_bin.56]
MNSLAVLPGTLVLASLMLAPTTFAQSPQDGSWLDTATNWNTPGADMPIAPNLEFSNLSECERSFRPPRLYEDALVEAAGWTLSGPAYIFGDVTVITGMANADGMCRPFSYQVFVFADGDFAGTLSPVLMDSRTDGSLFNVFLYSNDLLNASFNRYGPEDALCCASAESNLFYEIEETTEGAVLVPQLPAATVDRL